MEEQFDVVIVGSGGGSFPAALAAHTRGKKALILEKRAKVGGTTGFSGGMIWIPNNPVMLRAGAKDSIDAGRLYLNTLLGPTSIASSQAKREAYLKHGPEMISFLERAGMKFLWADGYPDYQDDLPGGYPRGRAVCAPVFDITQLGEWESKLSCYEGWPPGGEIANTPEFAPLMMMNKTWRGRKVAARVAYRLFLQKLFSRNYRGGGAAVQGRLLQLALRAGIPVRTQTAVVELLTEGQRVTGVVAESGGSRSIIRARDAVLLNSGGFARNSAMRERYQPKPTPRWTNANEADTGEVLNAAMAIGAAIHQMDMSWYVLTSILPDGSLPAGAKVPFMHHFELAKPHVIVVDKSGKRVGDESGCYQTLGKALYASGAVPSFAIIESRHRDNYSWGTVVPGATPQAWFDSGYMKKTDTIEGLAQALGIDPAGLRATVERFNAFAREGVDQDFRRGSRAYDLHLGDPTVKPNACLGAIEQPPFYGVMTVPGDVGTAGGLLTDEHARVLRSDNRVIEGLYATGNTTASMMGGYYPGPGATLGPSMVFGYLAALHATRASDERAAKGTPKEVSRREQAQAAASS